MLSVHYVVRKRRRRCTFWVSARILLLYALPQPLTALELGKVKFLNLIRFVHSSGRFTTP